jgi:DNA-binding NtrC family response regulator
MSIIFTKHFLIKLRQRKINRQFVFETIKNPNLTRPTYGFREELYRKFGKFYLKVVIKRRKEHIIVLTTHWVAKNKNRL